MLFVSIRQGSYLRHANLGKALALAAIGSLLAFGAQAQTGVKPGKPDMTPPKLDIDAFLSQSTALHANNPQVPASLAARAPAPGDITALNGPMPALSKANADAVDSILALTEDSMPDTGSTGVTHGLTAGPGHLPAIPAMDSLDHATAQAIVAAFERPKGTTANDAAQIAATAAPDPAFEERMTLVRTLYRVDGTDALIRHFVGTDHMRAIITEVNNHIDISKLSDAEKYRMSAIAASAQTELEDKILNMNARIQANNLTKAELLLLITAFDIDAQRKLTAMRLSDPGKLDRAAELDIRIAQYQVIKQYEAGQ